MLPAGIASQLLGQDRVVGEALAQGRDDRRLDGDVGSRDRALVVGLVAGLQAGGAATLDLQSDRAAADDQVERNLEFVLEEHCPEYRCSIGRSASVERERIQHALGLDVELRPRQRRCERAALVDVRVP